MNSMRTNKHRNAVRKAVEALENRVLLAYTLDPSFGGDGLVEGQGSRHFFLQNADVVAQSSSNQIRRVNADGTLDTTFGSGGQITTPFPIADIENAGNRFLVLGASPSANKLQVAAYTVNGALDTSFGGGDGIAEASSSVL